MFEIELNENYEDNFRYRDVERATRDQQEREEFRKQMQIKKLKRSAYLLNNNIKRDRSTPNISTRNHK